MDDFTQLQAAADHLADAVKRVAGSAPISISVTSRASRGVGTVTVSVGGRLQSVELIPAAMELPPERLEAAIQAAYVAACDDATGQARTLIADTTHDHPQFAGFFEELLQDETPPATPVDNTAHEPGFAGPQGGFDTDDLDEGGFWPTIRA